MHLYIQRHAEAESGERDDQGRSLTPHGRRQATEMGRWLARQIGRVDLILTSPFVRAAQTTALMDDALGCGIVVDLSGLTPDAAPELAWQEIRPHVQGAHHVLVVTHHPLMERLISFLCGAIMEEPGHASIVSVKIDDPAPREPEGVLRWAVTPDIVECDLAQTEVVEAARALFEAAPTLRAVRRSKLIPQRAIIDRILKARWRRQRAAILTDYGPKLKRMAGTVLEAETPEEARQRRAKEAVAAILLALAWGSTAKEAAAYDAVIASAISAGAEEVGAAGIEDFTAAYLRENAFSQVVANLDETTMDRLRNAVADAYAKGGSYSDIVDTIKQTFADFSESRLDMIAWSELNNAWSQGLLESAQQNSHTMKRWDTDGEACDICVANEEQGWIPIDDEFQSGDDAPTAHPRCDCSLETGDDSDAVEESLREGDDGAWVTINGRRVLIGADGQAKGMPKDNRVERAKDSAVRCGADEQRIADRSENVLSDAVGVPRTRDNSAFDLRNDEVGIEVKTLINGKNEKITMSKSAMGRKLAEQRADGLKIYTVVVDRRAGGMTGKASYYIKQGVGSFRLGSMNPTTISGIKDLVNR